MAHETTTGPVGPAPQEHNVVYTTLHFDKPWSYENYLKTGGLRIVDVAVRHHFSPSSSSSTFAVSTFSW